MDRNIINYQFLRNTACCISKLAVQGYIKDLQTYRVRVRKQKKEVPLSDDNQEDHAHSCLKKVQETPQSIFQLDERSKSVVLQTTTLLQGLLKKGFPAKPEQLFQLQISDLKIRDIYDSVVSGTTTQFVLIHKILYKKISDQHLILVVPEILGQEILDNCHNQLGFHFSKRQMLSLLRHLIYHPDLKSMINTIVS